MLHVTERRPCARDAKRFDRIKYLRAKGVSLRRLKFERRQAGPGPKPMQADAAYSDT
jgi:hypothetical protein